MFKVIRVFKKELRYYHVIMAICFVCFFSNLYIEYTSVYNDFRSYRNLNPDDIDKRLDFFITPDALYAYAGTAPNNTDNEIILPLLMVCWTTVGNITNVGVSNYTTPLLHRISNDMGRHLTTIVNNSDANIANYEDYYDSYHDLKRLNNQTIDSIIEKEHSNLLIIDLSYIPFTESMNLTKILAKNFKVVLMYSNGSSIPEMYLDQFEVSSYFNYTYQFENNLASNDRVSFNKRTLILTNNYQIYDLIGRKFKIINSIL
jgi:hypothetical protein